MGARDRRGGCSFIGVAIGDHISKPLSNLLYKSYKHFYMITTILHEPAVQAFSRVYCYIFLLIPCCKLQISSVWVDSYSSASMLQDDTIHHSSSPVLTTAFRGFCRPLGYMRCTIAMGMFVNSAIMS